MQDCILSQGRAYLVLELARSGGSMEGLEQLAQRAKRYAAAGADALALRTDADYTPEGLKDLWSVCRAVKVPVLCWDWHLHPLQVGRAAWRGGLPGGPAYTAQHAATQHTACCLLHCMFLQLCLIPPAGTVLPFPRSLSQCLLPASGQHEEGVQWEHAEHAVVKGPF